MSGEGDDDRLGVWVGSFSNFATAALLVTAGSGRIVP
jgi:hypothetical protein